jgi:hypothetical protein
MDTDCHSDDQGSQEHNGWWSRSTVLPDLLTTEKSYTMATSTSPPIHINTQASPCVSHTNPLELLLHLQHLIPWPILPTINHVHKWSLVITVLLISTGFDHSNVKRTTFDKHPGCRYHFWLISHWVVKQVNWVDWYTSKPRVKHIPRPHCHETHTLTWHPLSLYFQVKIHLSYVSIRQHGSAWVSIRQYTVMSREKLMLFSDQQVSKQGAGAYQTKSSNWKESSGQEPPEMRLFTTGLQTSLRICSWSSWMRGHD